MEGGRHDLSIDCGSTYEIILTITTGSTPWNLTGYVAELNVAEHQDSPQATVRLTSSPASGIVITASQGKLTITFTPTHTRLLTAAQYMYTAKLTSPGGVVMWTIWGTIVPVREAPGA